MSATRLDRSVISDDSRTSLRVAPTALSRSDFINSESLIDALNAFRCELALRQRLRPDSCAFSDLCPSSAADSQPYSGQLFSKRTGIVETNGRDSSTIYKLKAILESGGPSMRRN